MPPSAIESHIVNKRQERSGAFYGQQTPWLHCQILCDFSWSCSWIEDRSSSSSISFGCHLVCRLLRYLCERRRQAPAAAPLSQSESLDSRISIQKIIIYDFWTVIPIWFLQRSANVIIIVGLCTFSYYFKGFARPIGIQQRKDSSGLSSLPSIKIYALGSKCRATRLVRLLVHILSFYDVGRT